MFTWIYAIIDRLPSFLRGAFNAVAPFFLIPFRVLIALFRLARGAGLHLWLAGHSLRDGVTALYMAFGSIVWKLRFRIIPRFIEHLRDKLVRWTQAMLRGVGVWASGIVANLQRWTQAGINAVRAFITAVRDWVAARIVDLFNWIARIGNRVAEIVLDPGKLVAWILPALWGPLWRFIEARAEPIGRWLLARSLGATLRSVGVIERVIARIL